VIGFTEMGLWGITDDASKKLFQDGFWAIMEAIDEQAGSR
jgi:hypothetical protein